MSSLLGMTFAIGIAMSNFDGTVLCTIQQGSDLSHEDFKQIAKTITRYEDVINETERIQQKLQEEADRRLENIKSSCGNCEKRWRDEQEILLQAELTRIDELQTLRARLTKEISRLKDSLNKLGYKQ